MTPTGVSMGNIDPATISRLDVNGDWVSGAKPTKEAFLHLVMYKHRPKAGAVVHLHSTHSVAVSCLADVNTDCVLPPLTAYYAMRIGVLPLVPYFPPGDSGLVEAVDKLASKHHAILLANHGPIVAGTSLHDAVYATEELEETAKLYLLLANRKTSLLTQKQLNELEKRFPKKI
jgi:ribulose-5-phosphate 4-epimerase/fuculose-1-phosphate aldolase